MSKIINREKDQKISVTTESRDYRKELWVGIAIAVARAENCKSASVPSIWANVALANFDNVFDAK